SGGAERAFQGSCAVAGETGGLSDGGGLLGSEQTTELGGLDSDDVGGLLLDYGERIGRGADGLIGHDGNTNALGDLAEGIQVIGRCWLLKELHAGLSEDWEVAQGRQAVPAGVDVDAEGDAPVEGIDKLCDARNARCWIAGTHLELERLMPV